MALLRTDHALPIASSAPAPHFRAYVLASLVVVGALSWIDRQLLAMVMQSIKIEFTLSDSQLGLLGGTAFGLFYVTVGIPVAWLADHFNRRNIVALSLVGWSVMTALCGFASGYWTLLLARVGVGMGEAGQAAPSQSMISDYFPAERRGLAMGIFYSYLPIGYLVSYSAGGVFNDTIGWRNSFVLFGVIGLAVALLFRLTVQEPRRGISSPASAQRDATGSPSLVSTLRTFLSRRSMRQIPLAGAAHGIGMFAAAIWLPSFFMRTHHMSSTDVGLRLALIMGIGGVIGTLFGGHLADRLAARTGDARWYTWTSGLAVLLTAPFTLVVYLSPDPTIAFLVFIVPTVLNNMFIGPVVATMQNLAGVRRRAMAAAMYLFLANLISMGFGPLIVGVVSDQLQATFGEDALRYSLLTLTTATSIWASLHMFLASRTVRQDIVAAGRD